jgi:hypothetical protein
MNARAASNASRRLSSAVCARCPASWYFAWRSRGNAVGAISGWSIEIEPCATFAGSWFG